MTGVVARRRSGAMRGSSDAAHRVVDSWCRRMAGGDRRDVRAPGHVHAWTSPRGGLPDNDAAGLVEPRISAIAIDLREPALARPSSAIAPGGPDRRRRQGPPSSVGVDRLTAAERYALHVRGEVVARLHWRN